MLRFHFQLLMQVRLCPEFGGEGTGDGINVLNDTGSTLTTFFYAEIPILWSMDFGVGVFHEFWLIDFVRGELCRDKPWPPNRSARKQEISKTTLNSQVFN